jgi:hypothetical protein
MNYTPFARAALSALIVPALTLSFAPAFAAKSKKATAKAPVLTCNIEAADGLSYTVIKAGITQVAYAATGRNLMRGKAVNLRCRASFRVLAKDCS